MESRIEDILSATIGGESYNKPSESRIETLLINLKEQIDDKVDKESGKGLSTNDFTTAEKTKLDGLAEIKSIGTGLALDDSTGELVATGGSGGGGTLDYTELINKPQINSVILSGNKSLSDLGITYESETAASDGTTLSLVTTGEKYTWNNKQSAIDDLSTIRSGAALGATAVQPVTGKGLSANDYTDTEKSKLAGIAAGAEVNEIEGIKVNNTTINPDSNKIVNITVPTTAAEVSALPDSTKYAASLSLTINSSTFVVTGQLKDQNGDNLGTAQAIDLPLESVVVGGSYDGTTKKVVLSLQNGDTVEFSVADLVSGLQTELSASNKLNPAYINYDSSHRAVSDTEKSTWNNKQDALSSTQLAAVNSGISAAKVEQIETNRNNISSIQQEQIVQNADIAALRLALDAKIYGIRIDKQDVNPDTRVTYLYDAVGMTPAYMDFDGGSFNYGSWDDIWFIKNNRPVALKFDGTVDYELDHTDFTKKLDGTASDVSDPDYGGNFMSEMPTVYVKRWEDSRYNYIAFSNKQINSDFLAQAHTNANGTVNSAIYLPMFKGSVDSNNKMRSLMGTYPTGNTTGTDEVTYASNNGTGWQIWDKAKIDLLMDLIVLITKSTNCRAKIGNGGCQTYNASDTTNYGKMKSGYEADGTTRSASAQFYGSEGTAVTNYGKHHMIAFYIEDLWANRWDRCLGFNLVDNVYNVKMVAPYTLDSDSSYETLTVSPPDSEGWLKNVSSANVYGDVPTEVGASNTTGFANYFYKNNASGSCLSLFGCYCDSGLRGGRYWSLSYGSDRSLWIVGGSPCYNSPH